VSSKTKGSSPVVPVSLVVLVVVEVVGSSVVDVESVVVSPEVELDVPLVDVVVAVAELSPVSSPLQAAHRSAVCARQAKIQAFCFTMSGSVPTFHQFPVDKCAFAPPSRDRASLQTRRPSPN
jgi:TRAP-type mannitol/chloroaromatic compound transport system permease large subunit